MGTGEIIAIVSVCISFISVVFSVVYTVKNSKKTDYQELETRVAENTRLNIKLDNIAQDIADIKEEIRVQRLEVQKLAERMARVEASAKQAHHRLDRVEGKECKHDE